MEIKRNNKEWNVINVYPLVFSGYFSWHIYLLDLVIILIIRFCVQPNSRCICSPIEVVNFSFLLGVRQKLSCCARFSRNFAKFCERSEWVPSIAWARYIKIVSKSSGRRRRSCSEFFSIIPDARQLTSLAGCFIRVLRVFGRKTELLRFFRTIFFEKNRFRNAREWMSGHYYCFGLLSTYPYDSVLLHNNTEYVFGPYGHHIHTRSNKTMSECWIDIQQIDYY